jgi:tRNA-dihydrouridine synthase
VHDCAPADYYVTEFVNVDGLTSVGRQRLLPKLSTKQDKGTVIAQVWGKTPDNFEQIAREIAEDTIGGFYGVDLNFGCPDKAVVRNECCSALAQPKLRDKAVAIIEATQKGLAGRKPLSIKTRLGFDGTDYSWHELLLKQKPAMLTVHVRTTKQMSKVPAQWEAIRPIIDLRDMLSPETKIVLNGDIADRQQGERLATELGVDGIMIGRGVFHNPYCFVEGDALGQWQAMNKTDKIALFKKHLALFSDTYGEGERTFSPLKKFAKIYISGFDGASELREQVMRTSSIAEALAILP